MRKAIYRGGFPQSAQMNSFKFILVLVCFTPVSLERIGDLKQLKNDLLNLLEIKEKPKVARSRSQVPKYVIDLYKMQSSNSGFMDGKKPFPGKTIRTFFRANASAKAEERRFVFNLSALPRKEKIHQAELRIFKRRSKLEKPHGHFKVTVYRLNRRATKESTRWKRRMVVVDAKHVKCRRVGEWLSLNVTSAVTFWSAWPSQNFGLWISVRGVGSVPESDFYIATGGRKDPILVTHSDDMVKKYEKLPKNVDEIPNKTDDSEQESREEGNGEDISSTVYARSRRSTEGKCQKHQLFVKFRDLNWDKWIIAPRGFSAYYCMGSCPEVIDKFFDPTNHAIIQNLLHHRFSKRIPAACCVPTSLHSMSMLYFELDGSIVLREYSGMVASACGCR